MDTDEDEAGDDYNHSGPNFNKHDDNLEKQLEFLKKQGISMQFPKGAKSNSSLNLSNGLPMKQFDQQQQSLQSNSKQNQTHKKRKKSTNSLGSSDSINNVPAITDVLKNNKFALLSDLDISTTQTNSLPSSTQHTNESSRSKENENVDFNKNKSSQSSKFCPPIILYNVDVRSLVEQFKSKHPEIDFKITNCSKNKSKLFVKEFQSYSELMALLKEKKVSSHSFTPPQNKQISLILRGLHHLSRAEEIKSELDILIPNIVANVQSFITPYMRKNNINSDLFLVTLSPGKFLSDITNVKYIFYQKISWEKPRSFSKEMQCKRCQRWGHIAKNCNHVFQCVKCDQQHEPGFCLLKKTDNSEPYCINCKKWGHPANFRGCEFFQSYIVKKMAITKKNKDNVVTSSKMPTLVSHNKTFASLFHKNTPTNNASTKKSKLIEDFLLIAKEILNEEVTPLETRIQNFLENFKIMSLEERKKECIALLRAMENYDG